jgi:hypothetical protein
VGLVMPALARDFSVVAPDQRGVAERHAGYGPSIVPGTPRPGAAA